MERRRRWSAEEKLRLVAESYRAKGLMPEPRGPVHRACRAAHVPAAELELGCQIGVKYGFRWHGAHDAVGTTCLTVGNRYAQVLPSRLRKWSG